MSEEQDNGMGRTAARHARFAEGIAAKYRKGGRRTRKLTELAHRLGLQSVGDRGTAAGRGAAAASMRGGFWPHATAMRLAAASLKREDAGRRQLTGASLGVSGALRDSGEGSASLGFRIGGAAGGSLDRAGLPRIVEQLSGASLMRLAAPAAQAASLGGGGMIVPAMRLAAMMPGRGPGKAAVQAESAARGGAHTAVEAAVPRGSRPIGMAHVEAVNAVGAGASAGAAVDRLAGAARAGGMVPNAAKAGIGSAMEPAVHASAPSAGRAGEEGALPSASLRLPAGLRLPLAGRPLAQAGASAARAAAVAHGAPAARLLGAARADAAAPAAALVGAAALAHGASAAASRTSAPAAPRTLARTIAAPREALAASPPPGAASAFAPMGAPRTLARANAAPREALAASPPNAAPAPRALSRLGAAPLAVAAPPAAPHAAAHSAPPPPVLAQRPAAPHAAASAPPALAHRAPAAAPSPPAPAAAAGPGQDAPSQGGFAASAPPPASQPQPAAVDLKALTEQVYQMLERKLRIEKQRKGL